ncbi:MAG: PEP-CTERM sorting domain-containing protein [Planctomycetes bacterium]|nr:PEP-CTERM sorting domain-containing protein [Planctomycetota bacterium]
MVHRIWHSAFAALAIFALAAQANAGLMPTSAGVQSDNNNYRYTYGVVLTSDASLKTGDFFTIYDFEGLVPGSAVQPANFTFSSSLDQGTPGGIAPNDDPTKPNLTWTYTGEETLNGSQGLGNFSVISTNAQSASSTAFSAQTHRQNDGQIDSNITDTIVPSETTTTPLGVPEPATLVMLGIGLPLVGAFRYLRRRSGVATEPANA